ncbi:MAG: rRNA maturation RNase YbeY [Gammaproteobacteria bacterium]|nr:rRNA maturation RNase YbeY [Gammaproteobacteria bacterium]
MIPKASLLKKWVRFAFGTFKPDVQFCLRIVGKAESKDLNARYRGCSKPTNVLSFCYTHRRGEGPKRLRNCLIGDMVICAPVVCEEAIFYRIPVLKHWAHMVVHGCLHLMGYDHANKLEAKSMEKKEKDILKALFPVD